MPPSVCTMSEAIANQYLSLIDAHQCHTKQITVKLFELSMSCILFGLLLLYFYGYIRLLQRHTTLLSSSESRNYDGQVFFPRHKREQQRQIQHQKTAALILCYFVTLLFVFGHSRDTQIENTPSYFLI